MRHTTKFNSGTLLMRSTTVQNAGTWFNPGSCSCAHAFIADLIDLCHSPQNCAASPSTSKAYCATESFGRGKAAVLRAIEQIGYVQIDTISVVERAHHHVLGSRVANYQPRRCSSNWSASASYSNTGFMRPPGCRWRTIASACRACIS